MEIVIVGIGMGNRKLLTHEADTAIADADILIGARRMLEAFPEHLSPKLEAATPEKITTTIHAQLPSTRCIVVLVSGDTGFYSAAKSLGKLLYGMNVRFICGISSLQYLCARLGTSWDDATVVSMHGRNGNFIDTVRRNGKTFALTDGENSARALCSMLVSNGLGQLKVAIGTQLSYDDEIIDCDTAEILCEREFASPAVILVTNPSPRAFATHGIEDDMFLRGDTPMTKAEVRAVSLAKLRLCHGQTLWDVGAGTGSVSIEAARIMPSGTVYAIEKDSDALSLLAQNKAKFTCNNLHIIEGKAPEVLYTLPVPDAVFVGGSSGNMRDILDVAVAKNPLVRIVINAVVLETVFLALSEFEALKLTDVQCLQVGVSKTRNVGNRHMMQAQNPVFVISTGGDV